MADTTVATGLTVSQWDDKFFREYLAQNRYKPFMGMSENAIIQTKEDLMKKKGDSLHFALVNRLKNDGITGSGTLEGNEEAMDTRSHKLVVDQIRNGVRVATLDEQFSAISLRNAGRVVLKDWIMERTRDDITNALGSIDNIRYDLATEGQKDTWLTNNNDRVLFGAETGNTVPGDHSASLAVLTAAADKLTTGAVSLMKRLALRADPKIRPVRTTEDERWYVLFCNSLSFRDLKDDTALQSAQRDAWQRGRDNPLFAGGDLLWDGVIIKEAEDIPLTGAVGASQAQIGPVYLCGAQAIGIGWAQRTKSVTEEFDYGDKHGVAIGEIRGIEKLRFGTGPDDNDNRKQHGVLTGYFSAAADS